MILHPAKPRPRAEVLCSLSARHRANPDGAGVHTLWPQRLSELYPAAQDAHAEGAAAFAGAMMKTGYMFQMVAGTQLLVGVLLLLNCFVPLALVLIMPVLVNIIAFHIFPPARGLRSRSRPDGAGALPGLGVSEGVLPDARDAGKTGRGVKPSGRLWKMISTPRSEMAKFAISRSRRSTSNVQPLFTKKSSAGRSDSAKTAISPLTTRWAR